MKNILLPTDFSSNSWNAIEYALSFFKDRRCNFYLYHACGANTAMEKEMIYIPSADVLEKNIVAESKDRMLDMLKKIKQLPYNQKHNFVTLVTYDFLVNGLRKIIEEKRIDMIVMGTKGASGLKKIILGSNTGDTITRVKCPELVIPEEAVYHPIREIAFPTDFNILYNSKILDDLLEIATNHQAAIRVLHVSKKNEALNEEQLSNKQLLEGYLKEHEVSFHRLTNHRLEDAIQCFVESRDIDLIAMVGKNLNFFQQIFFRPAIETISYHTEIPFLVLHE
ncbi:universal stress protein [Flavobacteriaceae bacterium M23B6Z8]